MRKKDGEAKINFTCCYHSAGEGDHVIARAEYDFDGEGEDELSFRTGNILRLAPKGKQPRIRGWLLGTVDGAAEGIVPANYVKVV